MKYLAKFTMLAVFAFFISFGVQAQEKEAPKFEIVKYYFVDLITNPDRPELPKHQVDSIQAAHMGSFQRWAASGNLMCAGPFEGGGGMVILKTETMEEAQALIDKDAAVMAGRFITKIRPWYTTKGTFVLEKTTE